PRRGADHHAGADEDVPHPARLRLAGGGHRRRHAGRPAQREPLRAQGGRGHPRRHRGRPLLPAHLRRRRPPPAGLRHHRRLRALGRRTGRQPRRAARRRAPRGTPMSTEVANESGYEVAEEEFAALARYVLEQMHVHPQAELSILFVTSDVMTELHVKWMDEPGPTDVLSFPMDELRPGQPGKEPVEGMLGDIVLCPEVAAAQAKAAGHSTAEELLLLTTHGIL